MSGYPGEMQESLRIVEETRQRRLGETFRQMTADEKEKTLRDWHPDYREGAKRPLRIGPCKGDQMANEVADLLRARRPQMKRTKVRPPGWHYTISRA